MTIDEARTLLYDWLEQKDNKTVLSDDFSEAIELLLEETDFADYLVKLRERERKAKLPEVIDFWWMQEDENGNRLIEAKEHFACAMKTAYNVGLNHGQPFPTSILALKEHLKKR